MEWFTTIEMLIGLLLGVYLVINMIVVTKKMEKEYIKEKTAK